MKIKELPNGLAVDVTSKDILDHFLPLVLKMVKNKKEYRHDTAYLRDFRINILFIEKPSKSYLNKRKTMLKKAAAVKLPELMEEFRATGNKENRLSLSQFCNVFSGHDWDDRSLEYLVKMGKEQLLSFGRAGSKPLDLFEQFIKSKGFEFATWTGKEWV